MLVFHCLKVLEDDHKSDISLRSIYPVYAKWPKVNLPFKSSRVYVGVHIGVREQRA